MSRARAEAPSSAAASATIRSPELAPLRRELLVFLAAALVSALALYLTFPSWSLWPLSFVALAPWTAAVVHTQRAWVVHWGSFLAGWAFFLVGVRWLMPVTGLGFVALAFYLAAYWTLTAWAVRTARRVGFSCIWSLPIAWTACEYLRAWVMTGFPWLFVGHALYRQIPLIQIADLTGVYGVSFLALMVNGVVAEWWLRWRGAPAADPVRRRVWIGTIASAGVLSGALGYGALRLSRAEFQLGPRVAVIQEDFPLVNTPPYGEHPIAMFARYMALAGRAAQDRPDLIALPETVSSFPQNANFLSVEFRAVDEVSSYASSIGAQFHDATSAFARGDYAAYNARIAAMESRADARLRARYPDGFPRLPGESGPPATVVFGAVSIDVLEGSAYPRSKRYNSAFVYDQDGQQRPDRYDKVHLVPFGESVPFRNSSFLGINLHPVYRFLNRLSPFSNNGQIEYSLWPGTRYTVFDLNTADGAYRFGVPICYEDVMPYVVRNFVWDGAARRVDFLVNISNDGWFLHSDELPQHLSICAFRAVENRVPIARAVNTGISGFIDPDGRIHDVVHRDGVTHGPGVVGFSTARLSIDTRSSIYGRFGDVFARACLVLALPLWVGGVVTRWVFALLLRLRAALGLNREPT